MTKLLLGLPDEAVVAAFKSTRNAHYFNILFAHHQPWLHNTAFRILGCPDEADEIVQETFIKVLRNISNFKTNASLSAWLYSIVHNLCIDALRLKQKHGEFRQTPFDAPLRSYEQSKRSRHVINQVTDRLPGPAEQAELKEQMIMIAHSLTHIPDKQRTVVVFHDIEGLSYEDIAATTGINIGTIRSRLHYGRNRLRRILCPYFSDENLEEKCPLISTCKTAPPAEPLRKKKISHRCAAP